MVIDFSAPAACRELGPECAEQGVPYVVASTGLSEEHETSLNEVASKIPLHVSANTSYGVHVLLELVELASKRLAEFDPELVELHHKHKRDAPSGTALALVDAVSAGRGEVREVHGRAGESPRALGELGVAAVRGGDVAGEHTVYFMGEGERVELTHRASSPVIFAHGALKVAKWLVNQPAGRYTMRDAIVD